MFGAGVTSAVFPETEEKVCPNTAKYRKPPQNASRRQHNTLRKLQNTTEH